MINSQSIMVISESLNNGNTDPISGITYQSFLSLQIKYVIIYSIVYTVQT